MRPLRLALALLILSGPALAGGTPPPARGQYDSQLGGAYPPPAGTQVISRDREEPAVPGLYSICYVNGFQTQPQDGDWWRANHPDLLLRQDGRPVEDANWPGEFLLDTSTAAKREALLGIVGGWIDQCAADGFQAIEADNLDTYSRSDGLLSIDDNLAYAKLLVERAAASNLAFGQKNGAELGTRGRDIGFSFATVESCQVYDECGAYIDVYGAHVLAIEYTDTDAANFETACARYGDRISIIRRDRNLTTPDHPDYFFAAC